MLKKILTKLHIYLGLFFLVDLWLFALTGLFLNHPQWGVNDYRQESAWTETTATVALIEIEKPLERALHYLTELGLQGELSNIREQETRFRFSVRSPRGESQVSIQTDTGQVQLRNRPPPDIYGVLNTLHIFNGMQRFDPDKESLTWAATRLWVITMDGIALGLILLVLTGLYMWLQTRKLVGGAISLLLGVGVTALFLLL